ncbi:MAG: toxin HicA [Clostridiales bacterium]|nr:toxin HicA [Clostridiales bacterium]
MAAFDKLVQRIINMDKNLRFEDIAKVLKRFGYIMGKPGRGGSHRIFRKQGRDSESIPEKSPVKRKYVESVRAIVLYEMGIKED